MKKYDLVVIGSGPAGEKGGAQAAYFGKKVALIEKSVHVGGACINTGTVPSKTLRETALYFSGLRQRGLYGIDYSLKEGITIGDFMYRKDMVVMQERVKIRKNIANHHIDFYQGSAGIVDPHTVEITPPAGPSEKIKAEFILISAGSYPHRPPEIPFDDKFVFDSDTILQMDRIPKTMIIVGGGVIGSEYASIFNALGVKIFLIDGRDRLLPFLDSEISELLRAKLGSLGLQFYFQDRPQEITRMEGGVRMKLKSGRTVEAETALFAAGRRGNLKGLHLDKVGVKVSDRGYIEVDEHFQTAVPNIYAAGDCIGFPALASTSMEQGRVAVCHAFGLTYKQRVSSQLPMGVYTIPEISAVGESEESCREKGISYEVGRAHYANNARGQIVGDLDGMLKLVFKREDRKLVGVHVIGENATELIHIGAMVMEGENRLEEFIDAVFNYPTLSEMYKYAAYDGLGNLAGHKLREG
jgi:NAD(P) transhydrogenase